MYLLYNSFGFTGIYILILIISSIIGICIFNTLLKEKNNMILSFIVTLSIVYITKTMFAARNQIFSFLLFILEANFLIGLLEEGKKRYFWLLILLAFGLVTVHDTVYILMFIIALPYLAEVVLQKFKIKLPGNIEYTNLKNGKYLILFLILSIPIGFCTPMFGTAYTNLANCMNGVSTDFISELQPVHLLSSVTLTFAIFLLISIVSFTKTKVKLKDILFVVGFFLFSLIAVRNLFFFYLIGAIYFTNIVTSFINTYVEEKDQLLFKIENSWITIGFIVLFMVSFSFCQIPVSFSKEYVKENLYPIEATKWIKKNLDYENIRIWNHFNFGSYLELNGIKSFLDSRSGMYTVQENKDCTVLEDWLSVTNGTVHYQDIIDKYKINYVLVYNEELLNIYISKDNNYKVIYQDNLFSLYEKK